MNLFCEIKIWHYIGNQMEPKRFREIEFHEFSPVYNLVLRGDQKTPYHLFPSIVPDFALVQCLFLRKIPTYYFKIAFLKLLGM